LLPPLSRPPPPFSRDCQLLTAESPVEGMAAWLHFFLASTVFAYVRDCTGCSAPPFRHFGLCLFFSAFFPEIFLGDGRPPVRGPPSLNPGPVFRALSPLITGLSRVSSSARFLPPSDRPNYLTHQSVLLPRSFFSAFFNDLPPPVLAASCASMSLTGFVFLTISA